MVRVKEGAAARLAELNEIRELVDLGIDGTSLKPLLDFEVADPELAARLGLDRYYRIGLPERADLVQTVEALAARADLFDAVEREHFGTTADVIPNDSFFGIQWNLHNIGQGVSCPARSAPPPPSSRAVGDISATQAWDVTTGSRAIVVAILDSGVTPHLDLPQLLPGWSHDGQSTDDQCSHGTHVAGTVGAITNNNVGIAGIMWNAGILPVRVLTGCGGSDLNYGRGIIWAADRAHIANSSLQYYTVGSFFELAVQYAHERGLVMVAATGNGANVVAYPARLPGVIGVGATDYYDEIATFSNRGPQVSISAPGVSVYSLMPRTMINGVLTGSGCLSGTSMASPHVAGVAGLIKTLEPLASPSRVERILVSTVEDLGQAGWDQNFGWGRLNAAHAMHMTRCYVDCDMSGKLDGDDVQCFTNRFVEAHPYADMDSDGRFTSLDLVQFMAEYKAGCVR